MRPSILIRLTKEITLRIVAIVKYLTIISKSSQKWYMYISIHVSIVMLMFENMARLIELKGEA